MLFRTEKHLYSVLKELSENYGLLGVKCEFEAEGSRFDDVVRLRDVCSKLGVELYLKIGGAEAKRDVLDSIVLGVDGVIAPMIETEFAAHKFKKLMLDVYGDCSDLNVAINIESKTSIEHFDRIIEQINGFVKQVTFGRTDLSNSYFDKEVVPDSGFILDLVHKKARELKKLGFATGMGGSISVKTVSVLRGKKDFCDAIDRVETRKCILKSKSILADGALAKCFEFEKLYLLSVKERSELFNKANIERLLKLEQRAV